MNLISWWHRSQFRGDGTFTGGGLFSIRPRYSIRFPEISLEKPATFTFVFSGVPSEVFGFSLELNDLESRRKATDEYLQKHPNEKHALLETRGKYEKVCRNKAEIEVTLHSDGFQLWVIDGPLSDWVIAWTPALDSGEFWHARCRNMRLRPDRSYQLTIVIKNVDRASSPLTLIPVFSGGGLETP
jgi:hypothetical protein